MALVFSFQLYEDINRAFNKSVMFSHHALLDLYKGTLHDTEYVNGIFPGILHYRTEKQASGCQDAYL